MGEGDNTMRKRTRISPQFAQTTVIVSLALVLLILISFISALVGAGAPAESSSATTSVNTSSAETANEAEDKETVTNADATTTASESGDTAEQAASSEEVSEEDAEKQAYIDEWAPRIDAYLAGSALDGTGSIFAEAAYENGVDPTWSPAIACVETGKGNNCYYECNAWGWGSHSWPDWGEAIWSHVMGLARYGGQHSYYVATVYCPDNPDEWYSLVAGEMSAI